MNDGKIYSLNEIKEIIKKESNEIINQEKLNTNFRIFTKEEYFNSNYHHELVERNSKKWADDFAEAGAQCLSEDIVIFINEPTDINYTNSNITLLFWKSFHEIRHLIQDNNVNCNSMFEHILIVACNTVIAYDRDFYDKNYNDFFSEIDANVYGLNKTVEVLEKYPKIKKDSYKILMKNKKVWDIIYQTHDYNIVFSRFCELLKERDAFSFNFLFSDDNDIKIFHSPSIICNNFKKYNYLDDAYKILASDAYLSDLDYYSLTSEEINIMIYSVDKMIDDWIRKRNLLNSFLESFNSNMQSYYCEFLTSKKIIIDKRIEKLEDTLNYLKNANKIKR